MSVHFGELVRRMGTDGAVSGDDLLALRRGVWSDGTIGQDEADAIFALNGQFAGHSPEWVDFFVESLGEYIVNQRAPRGYVDDENAAWLIARIDADGVLNSLAELELLVRVLEIAANVPASLKDYALRQIEAAMLHGTGPTRDGGTLGRGTIGATEAGLLRRAIFAPASERPAAVGPNEADMLFRLKDATLDADNAPEWQQLFVQGVASYLQGYSSDSAQLSRERAEELQAFMSDTSASVGSFVGKMAVSAPAVFSTLFGRRPAGPDRAVEVEAARGVSDAETDWLAARIAVNGRIDAYEKALLAFLAEE